MSKHTNLKKYLLLIRFLENNKSASYPSLESIQEHLKEEGLEKISIRTIQRDFRGLREEFGIKVEYSSKGKGYYIDKSNDDFDAEEFTSLIQLLEQQERMYALQEAFEYPRNAARYILFEQSEQFKGTEHIQALMQAIIQKRMVQFTHTAFTSNEEREFEVIPSRLMEYRNRWYLIAFESSHANPKTFGLDRIHKIKAGEVVESLPELDLKQYYKDVFGITRLPGQQPERIVLSFTPTQGRYIKSLPLHPSQQILIDNEEECRISLFVVINFELKKEILSHGTQVKVFDPEHLRQEIIDTHKEVIRNYQME